jgi:hypothetical protein
MTPRSLALSFAFLAACAFGAAPTHAAGPAADYKIDADYSEKSPDGQTIIEQYHKEDSDGEWHWQFWARRGDTQSLLNTDEDADYPADFRFTNDCRFVARMQKTGSGEASLYLYKFNDNGFVSATKKPLGDLAWAYFKSRPESKKARTPHFHISAGLLKGTEENYRWMGVNWPENRYLVISLWGEVEPTRHHHQLNVVRGWHVRYDLETGKFDVPPQFRDDNAKALDPMGEDRPS